MEQILGSRMAKEAWWSSSRLKVLSCESCRTRNGCKQQIINQHGSEPVSVELTEADIPGASLDESLDVHNIAALRWWLQFHGIKPVPSWKKQQLISRLGALEK